MQLEERMILSFLHGVHHYSICRILATRYIYIYTLWHLCGYGVSPVDRYLSDLVNIILVYILVNKKILQIKKGI